MQPRMPTLALIAHDNRKADLVATGEVALRMGGSQMGHANDCSPSHLTRMGTMTPGGTPARA